MKKRGLSEMISYVLLIIIAVALAGAVYSYFKLNIAQDIAECDAGVNLVVQSISCDHANKIITVEMKNRGLFNIDGAFIRFAEAGRTVRTQLNAGNETFPVRGASAGPLKPDESFSGYYSTQNIVTPLFSNYVLEVQPAQIFDNRILPCEGEAATYPVQCHSGFSYQENGDSYVCGGNWNTSQTCANANDTNWNTYGVVNSESVEATHQVSYTKKEGSLENSKWKVKYGVNGIWEKPLAQQCWNQPIIQLRISSMHTASKYGIILKCYSGSSFITLFSNVSSTDISGAYVYEEAMLWADPQENEPLACGSCDDGNSCTADTCIDGACENVPLDCSYLNSACTTGQCNPATGQCRAIPANTGGSCDDNVLCTENDFCWNGACVGFQKDCSALNDVCIEGACEPTDGQCYPQPIPDCIP